MIKNLTKTQLIVFVLLLVLIAIFLFPILQRQFVSNTASEYEPWDPDNINVVKNNISQYNTEGLQINNRLSKFNSYKESLDEEEKILTNTNLDTNNYINSFNSIQPHVIFKDLASQEENSFNVNNNDYEFRSDNILNDVNKKIFGEELVYIDEFNQLMSAFNYVSYPPISLYYGVNISPKYVKIKIPSSSPDSSRPFGDSVIKFLEQPPKNSAKAKFDFGKQGLAQIVKSLSSFIDSHLETDNKRKVEIKANLDKLKEDFNKKNFSINQYAVIIGIPFFIIAALLMYWYGLRASNRIIRNGATGTEDFKLGLSFTLNTITVLLLILSLLILGLAKVIQENTLAALLGTIGGYILNNSTDKSATSKVPPSQSGGALQPPPSGAPTPNVPQLQGGPVVSEVSSVLGMPPTPNEQPPKAATGSPGI